MNDIWIRSEALDAVTASVVPRPSQGPGIPSAPLAPIAGIKGSLESATAAAQAAGLTDYRIETGPDGDLTIVVGAGED